MPDEVNFHKILPKYLTANNDVDDLRQQCSVYFLGVANLRTKTIFSGIFPNIFIPTGCLIHFRFYIR
jgi:hypothetical protein